MELSRAKQLFDITVVHKLERDLLDSNLKNVMKILENDIKRVSEKKQNELDFIEKQREILEESLAADENVIKLLKQRIRLNKKHSSLIEINETIKVEMAIVNKIQNKIEKMQAKENKQLLEKNVKVYLTKYIKVCFEKKVGI